MTSNQQKDIYQTTNINENTTRPINQLHSLANQDKTVDITKQEQGDVIYKYSHTNSLEKSDINTKKEKCSFLQSKKSKLIFFTILGLLIVIGVILIVVWQTGAFTKAKTETHTNPLIVNLKRELNEISRYTEVTHYLSSIELNETVEVNNETGIIDFIVNIHDIKKLSDNTNLYDAYIVLISMYQYNETNTTSNKELITSFEVYNFTDFDLFKKTLTQEQLETINSLPIMKVSFYENGTIHEMEVTSEISIFTKETLKGVASKVIPSISKELYTETESSPTLRKLEDIDKGKANYYKSTENKTSLYNLEKDSVSEGNINFQNSKVNSITETTVDNNEGIIKNVKLEGDVSFQQSNLDNEDYGEPKLPKDNPFSGKTNGLNSNKLKSDLKSMKSSIKSELLFTNKTIDANMTKLITDIVSNLSFVNYNEYEHTEEITDDNHDVNDIRLLRMLNISNANILKRNLTEIPTISSSDELKRMLKVENFLKPIEFSYPIFKYDQVGLQMSLTSLILIDTNNGKITLTSLMTIGSTQIELLKKEYNTQLGDILNNADIALENSLNKIDEIISKTKQKETEWIKQLNTIINPLKQMLDSTYNVGPLYRQPIMEVYETIQEYSKNIFNEITVIIENKYRFINNKINVINETSCFQIEELNEILNSFLNECQNYFLTAPTNILETFYSQSISYADNIISFAEPMNNFDINVYFDILDQISKGKEIYENFIMNFINIIENGLNDFSDSLHIKSNELLSEAINAVEYIGTAIENNIIITEVISEVQREETAKIAYAFRKKITLLIEAIFNKIKETYDIDINNSTKETVKIQLESKVNSMFNEVNTKMEILIQLIKSKIVHIDNFESYIQNNPDIIDQIETELLEVEEQQFNSLISVPLYQVHREFYTQEKIQEINSKLTQKAKAVVNQLYKEKQSSIEMTSSSTSINYNNIEEEFSKEFYRINNNIFEGLKHEKSLLYNDNFNLFIEKAEKIILNQIQLNYRYGRDYMTDINNFYENHEIYGVIKEIYRTTLYEQRSNMSPLYTNEFISDIENNLKTYIKEAYLNLGNNLKSYLKKQLIPENVDLYKYDGMEFVREYINNIFTFVENKVNSTMFNEENFETSYASKVNDIITNTVNLNTKTNNQYIEYKNTLIDDLPLCPINYCEYDLLLDSLCCGYVKYDSSKQYNLKDILKEFTKDYFNSNIIQVIFENFVDSHLKQPLNEFKTKVQELYLIMLEIDENFSDLTPFKNLMNNYEKESLQIINQNLGERLLIKLYQSITNGLNDRIANYFTHIASKLTKLNNGYVLSHLKNSVHNFMDSDEPSEILLKLNNLVATQQHKGRRTLDDIELMFTNEFDLIIESCYLTINDTIYSTINDIESNLPTFPFQEFLRPRKDYINLKVNSIKEAFNKSKEVFVNITIRSFILGVDEDDFYDIKNNNIALFKRIVGDPLRKYVNDASIEIENNAQFAVNDFNKNNFQIVKLRSSTKYFNEVKELTIDRILNSQKGRWDIFTSQDIINRFNHASTFNYKVNEIIDEISIVLSQLNNVTKNKLEPYFESARQNIRNIFEEIANDKIIKAQLLEYTNTLYSFFMTSNEDIKQLYHNYKKEIKSFFNEETENIYNKPEYKEGRPYYINQTELMLQYQEYETQILSNIENLRSDINELELDEKVISQTKEEYCIEIDSVLNTLQSKMVLLSSNIPQYELLNLTYSYMDLFNNAMNNTYFDSIKETFALNANMILKDKFANLKQYLSSEIEILHNNISELMNEEFHNFINIFITDSSEQINDTVIIINQFSNTFSKEITNLIYDFEYKTFNLFDNEQIKQKLLNAISIAKQSFILEINDSNIQKQIEGSDYIFREACSDRYIAEISEFKEQYLYEILSTKFEQAVNDFILIDGNLFGRKIYNKLINDDIMWAFRGAEEKLNFIYQYLEYVLDTTTIIGSSTYNVYDNMLPKFINSLQNEIISESENVFEIFLNKFKIELSESFINKFKETVLESDFVKGAFSSKVISVIKRAFSLGYDDKFKDSFVNIVNEKWVNLWKGKLSNGVEEQINEFINSVVNIKHEQIQILLSKIELELIDSSYIMILNEVNTYKINIETCSNEINGLTFSISNIEPFSNYINNELLPLFNNIEDTYNNLQNNLISKIDEVLDQFDNYATLISSQYQTETVVEFANTVYNDIIVFINEIKNFIINLSTESSDTRLLDENVFVPINNNPTLRNIIEENNSNINIEQLTESFIKLENYSSELRTNISNSQPTVNLINALYNFQSKLQTGLIQISNPITSLTNKLETLLTEDKLNSFKTLMTDQIKEVNNVVNNHNNKVSGVTQSIIDKLTDIYDIFDEIKNTIELNVQLTLESSLKKIKQNTDPMHVLESFESTVNPDININVNVLNIPFQFQFSFNCRYVSNVYFGMSDLNVNTNAFLGTQMTFTSTTSTYTSGWNRSRITISGDVQMSEIRITSLINMRKFLVHLDALINLYPITVNTNVKKYGRHRCLRLTAHFTKKSETNYKLTTQKITKNIPVDY